MHLQDLRVTTNPVARRRELGMNPVMANAIASVAMLNTGWEIKGTTVCWSTCRAGDGDFVAQSRWP